MSEEQEKPTAEKPPVGTAEEPTDLNETVEPAAEEEVQVATQKKKRTLRRRRKLRK